MPFSPSDVQPTKTGSLVKAGVILNDFIYSLSLSLRGGYALCDTIDKLSCDLLHWLYVERILVLLLL